MFYKDIQIVDDLRKLILLDMELDDKMSFRYETHYSYNKQKKVFECNGLWLTKIRE